MLDSHRITPVPLAAQPKHDFPILAAHFEEAVATSRRGADVLFREALDRLAALRAGA